MRFLWYFLQVNLNSKVLVGWNYFVHTGDEERPSESSSNPPATLTLLSADIIQNTKAHKILEENIQTKSGSLLSRLGRSRYVTIPSFD